jgi:hypothetical protein
MTPLSSAKAASDIAENAAEAARMIATLFRIFMISSPI